MPIALIIRMRELGAAARDGDAGFWPKEDLTLDNPINPARVAELEPRVMFPKLYRRLVAYFRAGNTDLAGFDQWIRANPIRRDDRLLLPTGELGNLHDLYTVGPSGLTPDPPARTGHVRPRPDRPHPHPLSTPRHARPARDARASWRGRASCGSARWCPRRAHPPSPATPEGAVAPAVGPARPRARNAGG